MSHVRRRVEGYKYLYERGPKFEVRVQVPRPLRVAVGKGELKKSLGGDFAQVRRKYPTVLAGFFDQIDAARGGVIKDRYSPPTNVNVLTAEDIEIACYAHFSRMVQNMRGQVAHPVGDNPLSLENRAEGFRVMIANQVGVYAHEAWSSMSADATWLCEEHGWIIEPESQLFEHLCRTMLRARLQCYRNELRRLEGKMADDPDADPLFGSQPPKRQKPPLSLGDLIDKFTASREAKWSASTKRNYTIIHRVIEEVCGRDTFLAAIDDEFCENVRSVLQRLPSNYQKHPATMGRRIPEVLEIAATKGLPVIGPATINGHLTKLAAIISFGRDKGWITGNPMAGIDVLDPIDPSEKRHPFTTDHLIAIFATEPWTQPFDMSHPNPSRFWAPLIGLYSGARLTDICGQLVEEMVEVDGVPIFDFVHRPDERHIKGGKSRRVPVHPTLLALGFCDFVDDARKSGRRLLFPEVKPDAVGKWGDGTSKWFSRKVKRLELRGRRLSFHSFRHTFEDAMRRVDLHDTPIGNAIVGRWSAGVSKNYGSKYPIARLQDEIAKVDYPGLRVAHLVPRPTRKR
jgi:integrase